MTVWDPRLMSPARALELGGRWPLRVERLGSRRDRRTVAVCGYCGGRVLDLTVFRLSPEELLAAVLRHGVETHDLPLSGAGTEEAHDARGRPHKAEGARDPGGSARGGEPRPHPVRRGPEAPARRRAESGA
ncbi:MAG: hypothetical protein M0010_15345 [Actinomycetota bacterium]|nr:hypothetical protein [Actinomycetota bacterium]